MAQQLGPETLGLRDEKLEGKDSKKTFSKGLMALCMLFSLWTVGSFTVLPSKTGLFVWNVLLPVAMAGTVLLIILIYDGRYKLMKRSDE